MFLYGGWGGVVLFVLFVWPSLLFYKIEDPGVMVNRCHGGDDSGVEYIGAKGSSALLWSESWPWLRSWRG